MPYMIFLLKSAVHAGSRKPCSRCPCTVINVLFSNSGDYIFELRTYSLPPKGESTREMPHSLPQGYRSYPYDIHLCPEA